MDRLCLRTGIRLNRNSFDWFFNEIRTPSEIREIRNVFAKNFSLCTSLSADTWEEYSIAFDSSLDSSPWKILNEWGWGGRICFHYFLPNLPRCIVSTSIFDFGNFSSFFLERIINKGRVETWFLDSRISWEISRIIFLQ